MYVVGLQWFRNSSRGQSVLNGGPCFARSDVCKGEEPNQSAGPSNSGVRLSLSIESFAKFLLTTLLNCEELSWSLTKRPVFTHPLSAPRRLTKKPSLTFRIRQHATCHVILVDKKKRPTFHPANPTVWPASPATTPGRKRALSLDYFSSSRGWGMALLRRSVDGSQQPGAAIPDAEESESPRGGDSSNNRADLSLEVPSEIVLGELATPPYAFQGDGK